MDDLSEQRTFGKTEYTGLQSLLVAPWSVGNDTAESKSLEGGGSSPSLDWPGEKSPPRQGNK